ncbi:hypothetical protein AOCH_006962, partial [Aspergillus ochraceoroseus]
HIPDLLAVVATPDPELEDPVSGATRVVWDAIESLAWRSQHMQILLFIIHTQTDWPWKQQPRYIMTTRQQKTWQQLWQMAMQESRRSPDPMEVEDQPPAVQPFIMTVIETACLEFCIELLNQKIKVHEYESLLICAMAMLGWGEVTWRGPESYPPIISRVLKVARFMLVQKALWLDPQYMEIIRMWAAAAEQGSWMGDAVDEELGFIIDEGYVEGPNTPVVFPLSSPLSSLLSPPTALIYWIPRTQGMPFQAGVDWMVQQFMVRGQHGPVEVLLDWRTFRLKIHYNTTAPGHVTWMGQEWLLYKEMNQWPAIPWDQLFDNPTEATPGWSFLQDARTRWPVAGCSWLLDWIVQEPAMACTFTTQGEVSGPKIQKYFQQVAYHYHNPRLWGPDVGSGWDWTSERFREVLKQESWTSMGLSYPLNIAHYWDIAVEREQEMATIEADEDPNKIRNIMDEQASHTPHVAGMIYGWEVTEFKGSTTTRQLKFRASSMDWY